MRITKTIVAAFGLAAAVGRADAAVYLVTNGNDTGAGSLREAILAANASPGVDSIEFNLPGGGVHLFLPNSPLPFITETVSIDGWTQPNFAGTPVIEIGGDNAGAGANGLVLIDNSSQIRGLVINGFSGMGIYITGTGNASIYGCYIGTNNDGAGTSFPNGSHGIFIEDSPNNDIGGTSVAGHRNVISNNGGHGVYIYGAPSTGNFIRNNHIGTDVTGTVAAPNSMQGVRIEQAPGNTIGGSTSDARNVISGNASTGVIVFGFDAVNNLIHGNHIGTDAGGSTAVPNGGSGIALDSTRQNTIGGTTTGDRNVIAGNTNINVLLVDCATPGNVVEGNYVGINAAGDAALGGSDGITVLRSPASTVGGPTPAAGNVVAGNGFYNIDVATFSTGTVVQNNFVGTDASGLTALGGGGFAGVSIFNVCNITVSDNVISGNAGDGLFIWGSSSGDCGAGANPVHGNLIGVAAGGFSPLGNGAHGVYVERYTSQRIGGTGTGEPNTIAHNAGAGVLVTDSSYSGDPASEVRISGNSIHDNGELGIDLSMEANDSDGVTPNDTGDPDTGANNLQNFPVITAAHGDSFSSLTVIGSINSTPSATFRIEVFGNDDCDPTGHGEGRYYLGSFDVTTGAGGDASFARVIATVQTFDSDWILTTTARRLANNDTSEFSSCAPIDSDYCGTGNGNCYAEAGNGSQGCEFGDCCNSVCDFDPYCCDNTWDTLCAAEAATICGNAGNEQSGDCFTANPNPGCYDVACVQTVCEVDPYCCDTEWDAVCAQEALDMCGSPCPGDVPLVTPGVVDIEDLLFLLAEWGATGPPRTRGDVAPYPTGDNVVDINDLLYMLASWGPCP